MPTPTSPPKPPHTHTWLIIALGRICSTCRLTQAKSEFDDSVPCAEDRLRFG